MAMCLIDVETRAPSPRARKLTIPGTRPRSQMANIDIKLRLYIITTPRPAISISLSPFPSNRRLTPLLTSSAMTEDRLQLIPQRRYHEVEDEDAALRLGPRKKPHVFLASVRSSSIDSPFSFLSCVTDPLVHYGRHFGRTEHALCCVHKLMQNGILRSVERAGNEFEGRADTAQ
jgi:hypothetical protein